MFSGFFLLFVNPGLHAVVLLDTPCAPQYISSLVIPCKWIGDNPGPLYRLLPFLCWEYFSITDMMTTVAFMWALIFMGLVWIREDMEKYGQMQK
jgi:hypothetical protein